MRTILGLSPSPPFFDAAVRCRFSMWSRPVLAGARRILWAFRTATFEGGVLVSKKAGILIVGNPDVCRNNCRMLKSDGYHVKTATNSKSAIEQVQKSHFDLAIIITGSNVAAMDLVKAIRNINPHIRAIVSTAYATVDDLIKAVENGVSAYIPKLSHADGIASAVEEALENGTEAEIFKGAVKMYGEFVALIGEREETIETWLKKRASRYKDRQVKVVFICEKERAYETRGRKDEANLIKTQV